jgi:hypothetical protein
MIRPEFLVERQGKQLVLYSGLLDLAHRQGLKVIRTRLVQVPSEDNAQTAIVSAEVETDRGTFSGIGDASPANVSRALLTATIRLAETRAKARALRDATNVGVVALEELGDVDPGETTAPRPAAPVATAPASGPVPPPIRQPAATGANAPSAAQLGAVRALGESRGIDVDAYATRLHGAPVAQLDRRQVSGLIDALKREGGRASSGSAPRAPGDP